MNGAAMTITEALKKVSDEAARMHLEQYFGLGERSGSAFTGAHFETFGANPSDTLTADDLLAVSFLSVHVPARAVLGVLQHQAEEIATLLEKIPHDLAMEDIPLEDHEKYFGTGSPALSLWRIFRRDQDTRWGVGATTASKLLARKRSGLIPIYDSVVGRLTGFGNSDGTWRAWHEAFASDSELVERLRFLRSEVGLTHISLLRILDVILWMHGSRGVETVESVDIAEES